MSAPINSNQVALNPLDVESQQPPVITTEFSSTSGRVRIAASIVLWLSGTELLLYTGQHWRGEPLAYPSPDERFYSNSVAYMTFMAAASLLAPLSHHTECGKVLRVGTRSIGTLITGLAAVGKPGANHFGVWGILGPLIAFSPEIIRKICWEPCSRVWTSFIR